jgi:lipoprotein NlpD
MSMNLGGGADAANAGRAAGVTGPARGPARAIRIALLVAALAGCSEVSLSDAPVTDLSARAGARAASAKPPEMAIAASPGEVLYTVQKGDTLFHLAANAHCTIQDLARWNGIDEHTPIFIGQQLRLQAPAGGDVGTAPVASAPMADGDNAVATEAIATPIPLTGGSTYETHTLEAPPAASALPALPPMGGGTAAASPAPPAATNPAAGLTGSAAVGAGTPSGASALAPLTPPVVATPTLGNSANPGGAAPPLSAAANGWIWPSDGPVTGKFDPVRSKGIEIAAPEGGPVVAVADGTVSYTGSPRDYGNLVILKHGEDLLSVYAHNKTLLVKEGQVVRRGQTIATAGKSANVPSTLHFEVRRNHVPIDPLDVLPLR